MDVKLYVYAKQVFFYLRLWFSCSREKIVPSPRQIHLLRLKKKGKSFSRTVAFCFFFVFSLVRRIRFLVMLHFIRFAYLYISVHIMSWHSPDFSIQIEQTDEKAETRRGHSPVWGDVISSPQTPLSNCHCCCAVPFQKIFNAILFVVCFIFGS